MPRIRATAAPASDVGRGDEERRRDLVELPDVGRASISKLSRGDRADGHRNVGERLVAARRGDDDFAGVDRLLLDRLILRRRAFGRAGRRLGGLLVGVRVGNGGLGERRGRQMKTGRPKSATRTCGSCLSPPPAQARTVRGEANADWGKGKRLRRRNDAIPLP